MKYKFLNNLIKNGLIQKLFLYTLIVWTKVPLIKKLANSVIFANDLCQPSVARELLDLEQGFPTFLLLRPP
jgi:hypothetical protein